MHPYLMYIVTHFFTSYVEKIVGIENHLKLASVIKYTGSSMHLPKSLIPYPYPEEGGENDIFLSHMLCIFVY